MSRQETRDFPTAVIASLATGILLCKFDEMHEAAEFLMGHPIWTHHFANADLWHKMRQNITEQCPDMPTELSGVNKENYTEKLAEIESAVGVVVKIRKGNGETAMLPTEGLPEGKALCII